MPKRTYEPREVQSEEERNSGRGSFLTLKKTGEQFLGYALFEAKPGLSDNPGYFEYFEHYTPATGYCPCAGEDCPLCAEGDNPTTRAKSMWLVVAGEDDDVDSGEVKIFNLNYGMIQELAEDGSSLPGSLYRVKRLEGKGNYSFRPKTAHLTKTQLKAVVKDIDDDLLKKQAVRQMKRVFEELDVADAMEDDDDDDDDTTTTGDDDEPKARKGKEKKKAEPADNGSDPDAFDPEEADAFSGKVTVLKIDKKQNIATVEDENGTEFDLYGTDDDDLKEYAKGDELLVEATKDDDGDFVVSDVESSTGEPEAGAELPDEIDDEVVTITKINGSPEDTLEVEREDGTEFTLFFLGEGEDANGKDWDDLDLDDFEVGQEITISAAKDSDGDMLASVFPEPKKAKKKEKAKGRK